MADDPGRGGGALAYSDDPESPYGISARTGCGNWEAFVKSDYRISDFLDAAADWKTQLAGVERPWLCWSVNSDWCLVQQRLVAAAGWVPVVGFDPRAGQPETIPGALLVDFNRHLKFELMKPHFILDLVFAFTERLAFWHSDLLLDMKRMKEYASLFAALRNGAIAAVDQDVGFSRYIRPRELRYWELLGCTTAEASRSNFETGCGWWQAFYLHPNCPDVLERKRRFPYHWEYGVGIRYWERRYGGSILPIPERDVADGHFTRINNTRYVVVTHSDWRRNISKDLPQNFDLRTCCAKMGIEEFLA